MMDAGFLQSISSCSEEHRAQLRYLVAHAPPGSIVECGVYRGGSAAALIDAAGGKRDVWLFDSFRGFPDHGKEDDFEGMPDLSKGAGAINMAELIRNLSALQLDLTRVNFVPGFFADSCRKMKELVGPIALLHFDGDLAQSLRDVCDNLLDLVVIGGIIVIHDYPAFPGLKAAADKIFGAVNLRTLDNQSAFWVRPAV